VFSFLFLYPCHDKVNNLSSSKIKVDNLSKAQIKRNHKCTKDSPVGLLPPFLLFLFHSIILVCVNGTAHPLLTVWTTKYGPSLIN
jgi:hypothetical protein